MLKNLRKKGFAKRIFIVLAVVIVPAFVLWGSASLLRSQRYSYAGKIFGRKVSLEQFQESLRAVQIQGIIQFGENFFKLQQFLNLSAEAWDRLILLQEARKRKIKAPDQEVIEEIKQLPFFQRDGEFDDKLYQDLLRYGFKIPARHFEEYIRQRIILNKLYLSLTVKITVSEDELWSAYKRENEKVRVNYIFFPAADFEKDATVTEKELKSYFTAHQQELKLPPAINIHYAGFEYPAEASEEDKQGCQQKAIELYAQLQNGIPLEKAAEAQKAALKETGLFSPEQTIPAGVPFEVIQAALLLKAKQYSNPVITAKGCFIVQIKERKEGYLPDFTEAKPRIEKILLQQKGRKLAEANARRLREKIDLKKKDFAALAKDAGLKLETTPLFKIGEYLATIGPSAQFQNAAFNLKDKNQISEVVSGPQGFYILKLEEIALAERETFKAQKEEFKTKILEEKKKESFNRFFEDLKAKANLQDNIPKMGRPRARTDF